MISDETIKEIKGLIEAGFDVELISFEFDIPIETVRKCKAQMEQLQNQIKVKKPTSKMEQLRKRYKELYYTNSTTTLEVKVEMTEEQCKLIDSVIEKVKEIVAEMNGKTISEKRKSAQAIFGEIKKIHELQLTIEQAKKLLTLLNSSELKDIRKKKDEDTTNNKLMVEKDRMIRKLAAAFEIEQAQITDIEKLNELKKSLNEATDGVRNYLVEKVKTEIADKIAKIQRQNAINRIRNDIPEDIETIIRDLAEGKLDIEKANEIIRKEAAKRVQSKPKSRFSVTEQQEIRQIIIQIKIFLREKSESYNIENPEVTIQQLCKLTGENEEASLNIVVENYIRNKNFEKAKELCAEFYSKNRESERTISISNLRKRIRNEEIGDVILEGIQKDTTIEEDEIYFKWIEKVLSRENKKLRAIPLGKNQDGTRDITLADIWEDERKR